MEVLGLALDWQWKDYLVNTRHYNASKESYCVDTGIGGNVLCRQLMLLSPTLVPGATGAVSHGAAWSV